MPNHKRLLIDINEGMRIYQSALRALLPAIEEAQIPWREPDNYDDWDDIAAVLFRSIILNAIAYTVEGHSYFPIADYGLVRDSYAKHSFLIRESAGEPLEVFVRLETETSPFDIAAFTRIDQHLSCVGGKVRVPFATTKFAARMRSEHEETTLRYLKISSQVD